MMVNTYVESRLNLWAEWRHRRLTDALGYPRRAAFVREPGSGYWTPEMESASYEMDKCVVALIDERKLAVLECYATTGTREQKAKRLGCCLRTYEYRLEAAKIDLLGYLNDLAAGVPLPMKERA